MARGDAVEPLSPPSRIPRWSDNSVTSSNEEKQEEKDNISAQVDLVSLSGDEVWEAIEPFVNSDFAGTKIIAEENVQQQVAELLEKTPLEAWDADIALELCSSEKDALVYLNEYILRTHTDNDNEERTSPLDAAIHSFDTEAAIDGCFPAIFARALLLGTLSRRRIYAESRSVLTKNPSPDWQPQPGILSQIAWLLTSSGGSLPRFKKTKKASAAMLAAEAGDFHAELAFRREGSCPASGCGRIHHWRWRGYLSDYCYAEPSLPNPNAPAILLVHGFGAFGEHWRGNIQGLADMGYYVYAPTFPGYGRAEKPSVGYGQGLWRDYLADFVQLVVKKRVVAAGNSIGGFISASLAADYPHLVDGLILLNSAGRIQPDYILPTNPPTSRPLPSLIVDSISSGLFKFLEGDIGNQLRRLYPTRPERADAWLGREIARAAADPGALGVFRSVFYLPPPRALNYLVQDKYGGPCLVLQGALDPLNDAVGRAKQLERTCQNVEVILLEAGHCPHDEVPELVNASISSFIEERVM